MAASVAASRYSYTPFFFRYLELRKNNQSRKFLICVNAVSIRWDNEAHLLTKKAVKRWKSYSNKLLRSLFRTQTQPRSQGPLSSYLVVILVVVVIFQVLCKFFSLPQIPNTVQPSTGKNSAKCNALNSYIECDNPFALFFADPQPDCYKFHSLLGSVGKLNAETNFNFPTPSFNHISGICKNLVDT